MWAYILCAIAWIINIIFIIQAIRKHTASEIYEHVGVPILFTSLFLSLVKIGGMFPHILWLEIIGFILFIPAAFLVVAPIITLERKGRESKADVSPILAPSDATIMVNTSIYRLVRHPMYLGTAIWSFALILVFQSILSLALGIIAIFCFWAASKKEDEFNIEKFGDTYREYMKRVPKWNVFKGIRWARKAF